MSVSEEAIDVMQWEWSVTFSLSTYKSSFTYVFLLCPMDCGLSCLEGITECIKSVSFKWRARFFCCVKHYSLFGSSMGFIDWFHTVETWPLADVWGPATTLCDSQSRQLSPCYVDQGVLISDKIQKIEPLTYLHEAVIQSSQGSEVVICNEHGRWPEYSSDVLRQILCLIKMMPDHNGLCWHVAYEWRKYIWRFSV